MSLLNLPDSLLVKVLGYLSAVDLIRFSFVSRRGRTLADSYPLWKFLVIRDWPLPDPLTKNWRRYYESRYRARKQHQLQQQIAQAPAMDPSLQGLDLLRSRSIAGKYRILKKIGSGSFGEIHLAVNEETNEKVAIKLEPCSTKHPQLQYEARVYKQLQGAQGIPNVFWYGVECEYNVMVMELLGPSLEELFVSCGRKFTMKTILMLAQQMIRLIEYQHTKHFIHRDVKPDNFTMGRSSKASTVFLIDFGLAKKYRDSKTHAHLPYRTLKNLTGTPRYASVNTHLGIEQSRRDDLESLGYVLLYFCRGSLPWQGLPAKNKKQKYQRITEKKVSTSVEQLCEGFPTEFVSYLKYTKNLRFADKPDYDYLHKLFRELFIRKGYKNDGVYDWTPRPRQDELPTTTEPVPPSMPIAHRSAGSLLGPGSGVDSSRELFQSSSAMATGGGSSSMAHNGSMFAGSAMASTSAQRLAINRNESSFAVDGGGSHSIRTSEEFRDSRRDLMQSTSAAPARREPVMQSEYSVASRSRTMSGAPMSGSATPVAVPSTPTRPDSRPDSSRIDPSSKLPMSSRK
eukprot:TRINITY_DN75_c0_g1_i1.p1 TRINITY_DN75_c0_g1~~TRINITY_DN75_c0_g1_i1.p1  ORF type:complete len:569 (-),score=140.49 TRINITY_DN75_c0_g1_i1:345-2051(-)